MESSEGVDGGIMPVPFPAVGEAKVVPPDAVEARLIAGGVAGAVSTAGGLTSLQRVMIEAVTESMTGFVVPLSVLPRLGPDEFARALSSRDERFRSHMLRFMLLGALVLNPLPEEVVDRVDLYARELGVENDMLRIARRFARGSFGLALVDFQRSGYMETWDPSRSPMLHTSQELTDAWQAVVRDEQLAERWESLRDLPDGALGREVAKFYDARGFVFPGRPGSAPPLLAQHDWVHVLADYGSTVESEIEVFAFIARANDDPRAFSLLAQVISLFETGYTASGMGLFQYDRGHLSHQGVALRLADALRRGALSAAANQSIDFLAVDWFEYAELPLEEVRGQLGIVAKDPRAIEAGSATPWEPGGISAYQYQAGIDAAERHHRSYDSYGATPPSDAGP
jgi:hypothetical protein